MAETDPELMSAEEQITSANQQPEQDPELMTAEEMIAAANVDSDGELEAVIVPSSKVAKPGPPPTNTLEPIDLYEGDELGKEMVRRAGLPRVPGIPEAESRRANLMGAMANVGDVVKRIIPEPGHLPELPMDPTGQMDVILQKGMLDFVNAELENAKAIRIGSSTADEIVRTELAQPEDFEFIEDHLLEAWAGKVSDMFPGQEEAAIREFLNHKGQVLVQGPSGLLRAITPETVGDAIIQGTLDIGLGVWEASGMTVKGLMSFLGKMNKGSKKGAQRALKSKIMRSKDQAAKLIDPNSDADRWAEQLELNFEQSGKLDAETVLASASLRRALSSDNVILMMKTAPRDFIKAVAQLGQDKRVLLSIKIKTARQKLAKKLGKKPGELDLTKLSIQEAGLAKRIIKREMQLEKNKAGALASYFQEVRSAMNNQGVHGKEIMRRMDAADTAGREFAADVSAKVQSAIDDLSEAELRQLRDLTDPNAHSLNIGSPIEVTKKTRRAFTQLKKALNHIQRRIINAGPDSGLLDEVTGQPLVNAHTLFAHVYDFNNPGVRRKVQQAIIDKAEREALGDPSGKFSLDNAIETVTGGLRPNASKAEIESLKLRQVDQANEIINRYIAQTRETRAMHYEGSQEFTAKWQIPGSLYNDDPKIVFREVIESYARRVTDYQYYGPSKGLLRGTKIQRLLDRMREEGFDHRFAEDVFDAHIKGKSVPSGAELREASKILRGARAVNVTTKLSLAQMRNSTQFVNTAVATNMKTTAKAMLEVRQAWGHERLHRIADELIGKSMHDAMRGAGLDTLESSYRLAGVNDEVVGLGERVTRGLESGAEKTLKWTGFTAIETFNRRVAFQAGYRYFDETAIALQKNTAALKELIATGAPDATKASLVHDIAVQTRQLRKLDIPQSAIDNIANGTKPSDKWRIRAGHTVIKDAQFETTVKDLPLFWSSDYGKFFTQFKSFSFRHAYFMQKHAFDEAFRASHRNYQPLAEFLAWGGAVGFTQQSLIDYVRGKDKDEILYYQALSTGRKIAQLHEQGELASKAGVKQIASMGQVAMRSYLGIGSAGIFFELISDLLPEIFRGGDYQRTRPGEILLGPTAGTVNDASQVLRSQFSVLNMALPPNFQVSPDAGIRAAVKNIPVVGPAAAQIHKRPVRKGPGKPKIQQDFEAVKRKLFGE